MTQEQLYVTSGGYMNVIRAALLAKAKIAMDAYVSNPLDFKFLHQAQDFNNEFLERSRGKGRSKPFIRSVAGDRGNCTLFPIEKRNGFQGRTRRALQTLRRSYEKV